MGNQRPPAVLTFPPIVREISEKVNLTAVRLVRSKAELNRVPVPPTYEFEMDITLRLGGRKAPTGDGFIQVLIGLDVVARPLRPEGEPKAETAATVSCDFGLDYRIAETAFYDKLKDADVVYFGARNGMFNAWPYARAHVQTVAASMMMPLILPTYRPEIMFPDLTSAVEKALQEINQASLA